MAEDRTFVELLVLFGRALREAGLPVGSGDLEHFCNAVTLLDPDDLGDLYWSGRATLISRRDHIAIYDRIFREFFSAQSQASSDGDVPPSPSEETHAVLKIPDSEIESNSGEEEETQLGLVASNTEISRDKSFADCTPEELVALRRIMARMSLSPPQKKTRRRCVGRIPDRLDIRRMARQTMRLQYESPRLLWSSRKLKVRPLVFILDVSGSMSDYSRNLLQFACSSRRAAGRVEVFCFGTRLTRITLALDRPKLDDAITDATKLVTDWDGGTQIGASLQEFVQQWGRRGMGRGAIVVICSDGHDRGEPAVLADALEKLDRLSHRIVWMNPYKGDVENYQPTTLGMTVANRFVDTVVSGHNLRSLEDFAVKLPQLR
ncbi:MAG: VWA domain-containing protein [Acidimicrobiales bacterium]|nr:VWA domain-containing protein [Acidimicrobiales bacterium]